MEVLRRTAGEVTGGEPGFDGLREMLAEDVQLELVGMTEKSGATDVGGYFNTYARLDGMRLELGAVDGRPALLMRDQPDGQPVYLLFVRFRGERIRFIRDYRYARHVLDEAQWTRSADMAPSVLPGGPVRRA